jgi:hypothetical protein
MPNRDRIVENDWVYPTRLEDMLRSYRGNKFDTIVTSVDILRLLEEVAQRRAEEKVLAAAKVVHKYKDTTIYLEQVPILKGLPGDHIFDVIKAAISYFHCGGNPRSVLTLEFNGIYMEITEDTTDLGLAAEFNRKMHERSKQ